MPDPPRYYLPKLFGGSHNAQRIATSPHSGALQAVKRKRWTGYLHAMDDDYIAFETEMYTRREFGGPQGTVVFYAESSLSTAEACDRLWRYMMRATGSRAIDA